LTGTFEKFDLLKKLEQLDGLERDDNEKVAETKCMMLDRCRLVYSSGNSSLVDAKLIQRNGVHNEIPLTIQGIQMFGKYMSKRILLKYKAIIMLEGNGTILITLYFLFCSLNGRVPYRFLFNIFYRCRDRSQMGPVLEFSGNDAFSKIYFLGNGGTPSTLGSLHPVKRRSL
jgi:hypothetical protein